MRENVKRPYPDVDDRINCRIGELKKKLEEIERTEPGNPGISLLVRRYIALGIEHHERCQKIRVPK